MARQGSNVPIVYRTMLDAGLSPVQAAGVVGRFQQESGPGLNTTAHGDRSIIGGSHGIGQWNRERKANLLAFGGENWADPAVQARFALHEMGIGPNNGAPGYGSEAGSGKRLMAAQTIEDAGIAAMGYERPQGWTPQNPTAGHGYRNTLNNAQALFDTLGTGPGTGGSTANPITDYSIGPKDATGQNEFWNPISGYGGGPGAKPPTPDAPGAEPPNLDNPISGYGGGPVPAEGIFGLRGKKPKEKKSWRDALAEGMAGFGSTIGGGVPQMKAAPQIPTMMTQAPVVSPIDPTGADQQRQQLALALSRLNSGKLFAG